MSEKPDFAALVVLPIGAGCWSKQESRDKAIERVRHEVKQCYGTAVLGTPKKGATMKVNVFDLTGIDYEDIYFDARGVHLYDEHGKQVDIPVDCHEIVEVPCKK